MHASPRAPFSPRAAAVVALAALSLGLGSAAAAPEAQRVVVTPLSGAAIEGAFVSVGPSGLSISGRPAPLPLDQVREARFPDAKIPVDASPAKTAGLRLTLRGGESLRGAYVGGAADWIEIRPSDLPVVRVPFGVVLRVEAESAFKAPCDEPAKGRPPRPSTDVAYARSGDAFGGTWTAAGAEGVTIEAGAKKSVISWDDLVVLQVDEAPLPAPEGPTAEVETAGGSRLPSTSVTGDGAGFTVTTRSGLEMKIPAGSVAALRFWGGAFVYASDLAWTSTYVPFSDTALTFMKYWCDTRADRTPHGCPLRVAGSVFRRGFAAHSRSAIQVPLGKAFARFECRFGIDVEALDGVDGQGDVTARVLADGREVWTSGSAHVKGGEAARVVGPIEVTGVDTLVLEVDFGAGFDVMDRADWGDPVLVRAK